MTTTFKAGPGRFVRFFLIAALSACLAIFACSTIHWPIVGDTSLMHYAVFLMDHGAGPYRDIAEMNLPGSYFVEWITIHLFGDGQLAGRLFDLLLSASILVSMVGIALPLDWFAGFWAGSLFMLLHGRDGMLELGQRDLTISACLLVGYAFLFTSLRHNRPWLICFFGFFAGLAAIVKPTVFLLGPLSLWLACVQLRRGGRRIRPALLAAASGWALPLAAAVLFLWRERAVGAFLTMTWDMLAYHAHLARRPFGYLLLHSISPLMPLFVVWIVVTALRRASLDWERWHLWLALSMGLFSYLSQAKGYSYQRYPLLAFLLLVMSLDLVQSCRAPRALTRALGFAGLLTGALFLAPVSTAMAARYDWRDLGTIGMLQEDLRKLGPAEISGGGGSVRGFRLRLYNCARPHEAG